MKISGVGLGFVAVAATFAFLACDDSSPPGAEGPLPDAGITLPPNGEAGATSVESECVAPTKGPTVHRPADP
jgi:hypothetical protein